MKENKRLKSWLKRKVGITEALIVVFFITGNLAFGNTSTQNSPEENGIAIGRIVKVKVGQNVIEVKPKEENTNGEYFVAEKGSAKAELFDNLGGLRLNNYMNEYNPNYETAIGKEHKENSEKNTYANSQGNGTSNGNVSDDNKLAKSIAIGANSTARNAGIAIGDYAFASKKTNENGETRDNLKGAAIAIGSFATATASSAISLGAAASAQGSNSLAFGRQSAALGETSIAIGKIASATQIGSIAFGASSSSLSEKSVAIGANTLAEGKESISLGSQAKAKNQRDIAIGASVTAESKGNGETPSIAIGYASTVDAARSVILGIKNEIKGGFYWNNLQDINVLGSGNEIKNANNVSVIGNNNRLVKRNIKDVFLLGSDITDVIDNSVFLGKNSAYLSNDNNTTKGNDKNYNSYTLKQLGNKVSTLTFAGGNNTVGVVSVGSRIGTRRIQYVAPGLLSAKSTDAVNGSQLYAVMEELKRVGNVKITVKGGETEANSFVVADGGEIKVIPEKENGIIKVGIDNNKKAVTVGIDETKFEEAVSKNKVHYFSVNTPNDKEGNYNNDGASGKDAMAIGKHAGAKGENGIAIGTKVYANADRSIVVGENSTTNQENSIAFGKNVHTNGKNSVVIGKTSTSNGESSFVVGENSHAGGQGAVIFGKGDTASGKESISLGSSNHAKGNQSVALGHYNVTDGENSIASGIQNVTKAKNAFADGLYNVAEGENSIVIGNHNVASKENSMAMGLNSNAHGEYSIAIGKHISVSKKNGIGLGIDSNVHGENAIAFGNHATANQDNSLSIGKDTHANGKNSVVVGQNSGANEENAIAFGIRAFSNKKNSIVMGNEVSSVAENTIILGNKAYVNAKNSIVMGNEASSIAENTIILGNKAYANAKNSLVIGLNSTTNAENTISLGNISHAKGESSISLGYSTVSDAKKSIALGSESLANREAGMEGKSFGATKAEGAVWKATLGALSIGENSTKTRQITGVAAGTQDTDAVNVAQLRSLAESSLTFTGDSGSVKRKLGETLALNGNEDITTKAGTDKVTFTLNKATSVTNSDEKAVTSKAVYEAIKNAKTKIEVSSEDSILKLEKTETDDITGNKYILKLNQDKLQSEILLTYKANGSGNQQVSLANGLDFTNGDNTTAIIAANGVVKYNLNQDLKNIESLSNGENKIILEGDKVVFNKDLHMGNSTAQHQIKYVADGTDLTDAVNLKQLKEYNTQLEKKGLNFAGNDGKVIHKNLGEQLDIVGSLAEEEEASSKNLRTRVTDDGKLELLLAQNLNLNSVKTGNTIINNFGVTIQNGDKKVTLSENGLDNGGNKIVNVAEGTEKTDAVNKGQLDKAAAAATTEVTAGKNTYVKETVGEHGQKQYEIGLKDKITLGEGDKSIEADGEQGTLKVGDKITMDGTTGKATFGKIDLNGEQGTIGGLTNKTWDPNNYVSGQAATEDQLKEVDKKVEDLGNTIGKGYTFAGDKGSVNKKLGDTMKIGGDGKNISTAVTDSGELKIELNEEIEVKQITSEKMILKNSDGSTTDVGETLKEHSEKIEENAQSIKKGLNFAGNHGTTNKQLGDTMSIKGKEGVSEEDIESKYDTENVVTTVDKDGNLWIKLSKNPKFNSVEAGDGETKVTIGNDGVKIGDKTYITKDGLNANNQKIVNVADGKIEKDSKDAVNGGQIHGIVQDINHSINQTNHRIDKLDDRVHRGLANSAAMATLEFLEIGINQATVGAAVGTYRGNQAVAVGIQTAPTENTRVHAKVSVAPSRDNTETMAGIGASWRFNIK